MSFTLSIFLIPYTIFLLLWFIISIVAVYHMLKFGFKNFTTFATTILFVGVSVAMLYFSYTYIIEIDWQTEITLFSNTPSTEIQF